MFAKRMAVGALIAALCLCSCSHAGSGLQTGYYSAEAAHFDEYGWKEYLTIYVNNNTIVTVEYNAKNASGLIKSWDMEYMRIMNAVSGTYPNEYARIYSQSLLNLQNPEHVDAVTGATHSHSAFKLLANAVIARARAGDTAIAYVDLPDAEDQEPAQK